MRRHSVLIPDYSPATPAGCSPMEFLPEFRSLNILLRSGEGAIHLGRDESSACDADRTWRTAVRAHWTEGWGMHLGIQPAVTYYGGNASPTQKRPLCPAYLSSENRS